MALKRSPHCSLPMKSSSLVHYGSDSSINKGPLEESVDCDSLHDSLKKGVSSTIAHRNSKRKCTEEAGFDQVEPPTPNDNELFNFMSEIKSMFQAFKEEQNTKIGKIYESIEEIRLQNTKIQDSVTSLSENYDGLKSQIDQLEAQLEAERRSNSQYITTLEDKLERLERGARSTCVEIRNIPVTKPETKECLLKTVMKVGSVINAPIQSHEVKDLYRIGPNNSNTRTIIVDFTTNLCKEKFVRMCKDYNKKHSKLSTEHLNISGPAKPVFVSENLTPKMKRLLFLAKDFASCNDYRFCWVANGKIFLRKIEGDPHIMIMNELDLPKPAKSK